MTLDERCLPLVEALHRTGIVDSRDLPRLAVDMLISGLDTPALRLLAGLDLEPFDTREAADLLRDVAAEAGSRLVDGPTAVRWVACYIAWLIVEGRLSPRAGTAEFYRLGVEARYPAEPPEVMRLFGLDDMWGLGLQSEDVTSAQVLLHARRLWASCDLSESDIDVFCLAARRVLGSGGSQQPMD